MTDNDLIINGEVYNQEKLESLLETAQEVDKPSNGGRQKRFAAVAGVYFIPGVGQVTFAVTGAIAIGGITIGPGYWAYNIIVNYFKEHIKNIPNSNHNKHTKLHPGRQNEMKK